MHFHCDILLPPKKNAFTNFTLFTYRRLNTSAPTFSLPRIAWTRNLYGCRAKIHLMSLPLAGRALFMYAKG